MILNFIMDLVIGLLLASLINMLNSMGKKLSIIGHMTFAGTIIIIYYFLGIPEDSLINIGVICWCIIFSKIFECIERKLSKRKE